MPFHARQEFAAISRSHCEMPALLRGSASKNGACHVQEFAGCEPDCLLCRRSCGEQPSDPSRPYCRRLKCDAGDSLADAFLARTGAPARTRPYRRHDARASEASRIQRTRLASRPSNCDAYCLSTSPLLAPSACLDRETLLRFAEGGAGLFRASYTCDRQCPQSSNHFHRVRASAVSGLRSNDIGGVYWLACAEYSKDCGNTGWVAK